MSYRISYGSQPKRPARPPIVWAAALGGALLLAGIWKVWNGDLSLLLPGDAAVTGPALQALWDRIAGGSDAVAAFGEFCREVIDGAGAY